MAPQYYNAEEERPIYDHDLHINERPVNNKRVIAVVSGLALAILGLSALCRFVPHKNQTVETNLIAKTPACSTIECFSTNCDKQLAPFLCTEGQASSGCSAKAENWFDTNICTQSCDLRTCDSHAAVEDESVLPRHCDDCNEQQCEFLQKQFFQACGDAAPFVCLEGSSRFGCSDSPFTWAAAVETTCGSCCNKLACK